MGNSVVTISILILWSPGLNYLFVASESTEVKTTFSDYGESCNSTFTCDPISSLKCKDGVCKCSRPDAMIFNKQSGKCFVMSGERCLYRAISNKNSNRDVDSLDCVPHSTCSADGYCTCNYNYFEATNGTCVHKRHFLGSCDSSKHCKTSQKTECIDGKCICNRANHLTFNLYKNKCTTMAGYKPPIDDKENDCVPHADYNRYKTQCVCENNFNQTEDGICTVPYGGFCKGYDTLCGRDMICINEVCRCRFGQKYVDGKCVSKAGQPCIIEAKEIHILEEFFTLKNQTFPCTPYSECFARVDNLEIFECKCIKGFLNVNGECQLDYGRRCSSFFGGSAKCDERRNLQCINDFCTCSLDILEFFDKDKKVCRGRVGAPCQRYAGNNDYCTDGADCQVDDSLYGGRFDGICKCSPGYTLSKDRHCIKEKIIPTTTIVIDSS